MALAAAATEMSRGAGVILLVRHSIREPIGGANLAAAAGAQLTEEGRALARRFGAALPLGRSIRLFSSPVGRCVETAEIVADAARAAGGNAVYVGARAYLGAGFIISPDPVIETFVREGPRGFVRAWHAGELTEAEIHTPERAGHDLLEAMLAELGPEDGGGLEVHVGHDLTVLALLGLVRDVTSEEFPWPAYLDGVALRACEQGYTVRYRSDELLLPWP